MVNILFINSHFPLFSAPTCGGANRSQMFLQALTHVGHVDVVSLFENEKSNLPNCDVIHSGCPEFGPIDSYGRVEKFIRLLAPWNANNIFPLNRSVERFCDGFIARGNYDYIAVRYLFTAAEFGLLKFAERLIIDVDDNPKNTLLIEASNTQRLIQRYYKYFASVSVVLMSKIILKKCYRSFYSNPSERPSKYSIFLHNVAINEEACPPVSSNMACRILIIGYMTYWVNQQGTLHFLEKIYPQIKRMVPNVEVHIVGKLPHEEFRKKVESYEGVSALGYVEDINKEYENCKVVAVPIYYGSGTCVKVVEAMNKRRTIVSSPTGVRGLGLISGRDFVEARDDKEFANNVASILFDDDLNNRIAETAKEKVMQVFSKQAFVKILRESMNK